MAGAVEYLVKDAPLVSERGRQDDPVLLFLHIPKTAGSTLEHIMYGEYKARNPAPFPHRWLRNGVYYLRGGFYAEDASQLPPDYLTYLKRDDVQAEFGH